LGLLLKLDEDKTMTATPAAPSGRQIRTFSRHSNGILINVKLESEEELEQAIEDVFNPLSYFGWVLVGYIDSKTIKLQKYGKGSINEFVEHLQENQIQYGKLRLPADTQKTRDVFIYWCGPGVGILEKGKKKAHNGEVSELLKPYHTELLVTSKKNINLKTLMEKSHPFSLSHVID